MARTDPSPQLLAAIVERGPDPFLVGVVRDVSEREAARTALAAQRDHFARLLTALQEGTIELSSTGEVLAANDRFCDMVGYSSREEVIGTKPPFPWHPEDTGEETRDLMAQALSSDAFQAELEFCDTRQRRFPVLLTSKRLEDRSGGVPTFFMTLRDLTSERRAAESLAKARAELVLADDRERISRDLHDRVIQRVFSVGLTLEGMLSRISDSRIGERLHWSIAQLDLTIKEIRASIFDLERDDAAPLS